MVVPKVLIVKTLCDHAHKLLRHVVGKEVTQVHYARVILAREPRFLLALALTADVTFIPSWYLFACSKVLPKTVFQKRLTKTKFNKSAVRTDRQRFRRSQKRTRVNHTEQSHLLLPDLQHRIVESHDELLTFGIRFLFRIIPTHRH